MHGEGEDVAQARFPKRNSNSNKLGCYNFLQYPCTGVSYERGTPVQATGLPVWLGPKECLTMRVSFSPPSHPGIPLQEDRFNLKLSGNEVYYTA